MAPNQKTSTASLFETLTKILLSAPFDNKKASLILDRGIDINQTDAKKKNLLHILAQSECTDAIAWLIENGVDINAKDINGETPLLIAIKLNNIFTAKVFIEHGSNINFNIQDNENKTILYHIDIKNNQEFVLELLNKGANPSVEDKDGNNFLFYCISKHLHVEALINEVIKKVNINHINNKGDNVLLQLVEQLINTPKEEEEVRSSLLKILTKLLESGIDANIYNKNGETALTLAIKNADFETVEALLKENYVDVNIMNKEGFTPLALASFKGYKHISSVILLLDDKANPNQKCGNKKTIIEMLIDIILYKHNNKELDNELKSRIEDNDKYFLVLKEILDEGEAKLCLLNSKGDPYFFETVYYDNDDLLKLLVKYGANLKQKDAQGKGIVYRFLKRNTEHRSKLEKREYIINLKQILRLGADANSKDNLTGVTTLQEAIRDNCDETIRVLIQYGANLKESNKKGRTALHTAIFTQRTSTYKLLTLLDDDLLNVPDRYGILPINYAALTGNVEMVLLMMSAGAYVTNNHKKNKLFLKHIKPQIDSLDNLKKDVSYIGDIQKLETLIKHMKEDFAND